MTALVSGLRPWRDLDVCALPRPGVMAVADARELILASVRPIADTIEATLERSIGFVAAADVRSASALPRFDNSAMDGYALHAADLGDPHPLLVRGVVQAGQSELPELRPGIAIRVATGGAVPLATSAIVPDEEVEAIRDTILVGRPPPPGANVRRCGEDISVGDVLFRSGTRIEARHVATMAATGVTSCQVRRRPRVGVLSIGNELVAAGREVGRGKIVDINRILLASVLSARGAEIIDLGIVPDSVADASAHLSLAPRLDALVTTGGIAGSEFDVTLKAMEAAGGRAAVLPLDLKPGRCIAWGSWRGQPSLHLPGNPIAALVTAQIFAAPMLDRLAGHWRSTRGLAVIAGLSYAHRPGRTEYVLARYASPEGSRPGCRHSDGEGQFLGAGPTMRGGRICRNLRRGRGCRGRPRNCLPPI